MKGRFVRLQRQRSGERRVGKTDVGRVPGKQPSLGVREAVRSGGRRSWWWGCGRLAGCDTLLLNQRQIVKCLEDLFIHRLAQEHL